MNETLSSYLAREIATRVATIVPATVSVQADAGILVISVRGDDAVYVHLSDVIEEAGDLFEHIQYAAYSALAAVQDTICELVTRRPWPEFVEGRSPPPLVSISDSQLHLGYGSGGTTVVALPGISLAFLGDVPARSSL